MLSPLPPRPVDGHKGSFGHAAIIGGSRSMAGAVVLAGTAALRGGAGLVTVCCPQGIASTVAAHEPGYLVRRLPETVAGGLSLTALSVVMQHATTWSAVGLGPGGGSGAATRHLFQRIVCELPVPMVVDADGLNALAASPEVLSTTRWPAPRVFTPHPGELSRLTGISVPEINARREVLAKQVATNTRTILVLKGARTVVTDGTQVYINTTGNVGLATGGTGDVLTGLIVALLAGGVAPFAAATWGVYLHGLAGDLAAAQLSQPGLIASDLPRYIAQAWLTAGSPLVK
jgi:ADP-dependent NAD(P)H-hydrate dehydratase